MKNTPSHTAKLIPMLQWVLLFMVFGLISCSKNSDKIHQPDGSAETSSYVRFKLLVPSLQTQPGFALITLMGSSGDTILENEKVPLIQTQSEWFTKNIPLSKGEYRITKFIVLNTSDSAIYAVPLKGSVKSVSISKPLEQTVSIAQYGITTTALEMLPVSSADYASHFGYSTADFGFNPSFLVYMNMRIRVGNEWYDSTQAQVMLDATLQNGASWKRHIQLNPDIHSIRIPADISMLRLKATGWSQSVEKVYDRTMLEDSLLVIFETETQPRRLKRELTSIENPMGYRDESKTEYFYDQNGKLNVVKYYQRLLQRQELALNTIHRFSYSNNQPDSIQHYDSVMQPIGYMALSYQSGSITNISSLMHGMHTNISALYQNTSSGYSIKANYQLHNGHTMNYKMHFKNGNLISDYAQTTTGGSEAGQYVYDGHINPYHFLQYYGMYFRHLSKNNMIGETKVYGSNFPTAIPYKFDYTYDEKGYPAVLITSYKGYQSGQHLYRFKKVFIYE